MSLEVNIEKKLDGFILRSEFSAGDTATALLGASGCGKSMTFCPSSGVQGCCSRTTPSFPT